MVGLARQGNTRLLSRISVQTSYPLAQVLTEANADDATTGIAIVDAVAGDVVSVVGDSAYDTRPFYAAGDRRDACVVVPPVKNDRAKSPKCVARDRTIKRTDEVGRPHAPTKSGGHPRRRNRSSALEAGGWVSSASSG